MNKYLSIKKAFEEKSDNLKAVKMSKYMKDRFSFYGIAAPERKEIYRDFIKAEKKSKEIDWEFLDCCYADDNREFQYLAYDYLLAMKDFVTYEDMGKINQYVVNKSWWDTIDFLCKVIGAVGLRDDRIKKLMIKWSLADNIWMKRTAIEHQLCLKEKTDKALLEDIILNCLGSDEFFINKAIGWALRDYSKFNPDWTRSFIGKYQDKMSKLTIKEASKYI